MPAVRLGVKAVQMLEKRLEISRIAHEEVSEVFLHNPSSDPQKRSRGVKPATAGKWMEISLITHDEFSEVFLHNPSTELQEPYVHRWRR